MISDDLYKDKYLKYKNKYLDLKVQIGGAITDEDNHKYLNEEYVTFPDIQAGNEDEIAHILNKLIDNQKLKSLTFKNLPQILNSDSFNDVFLPALQNIFSNKQIEQLNISGDKDKNIYLNDDHLPKLVEILRLCQHLKKIFFNRNKITIKGYVPLITALINNALNLKDIPLHVYLVDNPIIVLQKGETFDLTSIGKKKDILINQAKALNITLYI